MSHTRESTHRPITFNTLQDYQEWANTDWLYEAGSDEAQQHARSKLEEEITELTKAIEEHQSEEIISELGDVLWTATANAGNAGVTLEDSFRHFFPEGTFDENPIPIATIDYMSSDFVSEQSTDEIIARLRYLAGYLGRAAKQWHNLSPMIDVEVQPTSFSEAWIQLKAARTKTGISELVIICSAIAQKECGASIQAVMEANYQKLLARKGSGKPLTKKPE